jgi:hypothetical protein
VYHACEKRGAVASRVFGDGTAEARAGFEAGRRRLIEAGWSGVCGWIGERLSVPDEAERERRRAITARAVGYFATHVGRLNDADRLGAGRAIGSGAVEGWAKTLGLRLKSRGARWNRANVEPMAALVCVRHTTQWENYWNLAA